MIIEDTSEFLSIVHVVTVPDMHQDVWDVRLSQASIESLSTTYSSEFKAAFIDVHRVR